MNQYDDREFSSPVCYLKEDDLLSSPIGTESGGLCGRCRGFLESSRWQWTKEPGVQSVSRTSYKNLKCALLESCSLCQVLLKAIPCPYRSLLYEILESKPTTARTGRIGIEYQLIQADRRPTFAVKISRSLEGFGINVDKDFGRVVHIVPADGLRPPPLSEST